MTKAKTKKKLKTKLAVITNCKMCPHIKTKLTKGFGYAQDYDCHAVKPPRTVAGYVEWQSEEPQDGEFPDFCPLKDGK